MRRWGTPNTAVAVGKWWEPGLLSMRVRLTLVWCASFIVFFLLTVVCTKKFDILNPVRGSVPVATIFQTSTCVLVQQGFREKATIAKIF